jgi:hypothetical protein
MPLWTVVDLLMVSCAVFITLIDPRRERHALWCRVSADSMQSLCSNVPHGLVTGGCHRAGHQTTGSKPTLSSSIDIWQGAGRDPKHFGIDPWISIQALSRDEWRRRALGASHVAVDTMRAGFTSPPAHIDAIGAFREILDLLRLSKRLAARS